MRCTRVDLVGGNNHLSGRGLQSYRYTGHRSLTTGQNATVTVTLTSINGFNDTIGLGCVSLPAAVNCHFPAPARIWRQMPFRAFSLRSIPSSAERRNDGDERAPRERGISLAGLLAPFSVLFGMIFWRFRKRYAVVLITVLVLSFAAC